METDLLVSLIGKKLEILEQLRDLVRRQTEIVAAGEMTALLEILAAKQNLIDRLQSLEKHLDYFREQDPDKRTWRNADDRNRCRSVSLRCEALLKEVMLVEKQCELSLQQRRDDCAERLQDLQSGSDAHDAYLQAGIRHSSSFDISSG